MSEADESPVESEPEPAPAPEPEPEPSPKREAATHDTQPKPTTGSSPDAVATAQPDTSRLTGLLSVAFIILTASSMVFAILLSVFRGPQGPWKGEYFDTQEFDGEATVRYARKIEFDFKKNAPFRGMPKDHFSVIWTTCLEIEETTEVRFRLSSDDGARLYVDDELIVDNWGAHATRTRTGKIELEPGLHHLRLDYFEDRHGANVKLLAAFDDGEAESLSPTLLTQPSDDADNPCPD